MLKIPGRRIRRQQDHDVTQVRVATTSISDRGVKLLRLIQDGKVRVARGAGLDVTVNCTDKQFGDVTELCFEVAALGRGGYVDLQGQDKPWWDFEDVTVYLTGLGEAVLAAREALARSGAAAAGKIAARA